MSAGPQAPPARGQEALPAALRPGRGGRGGRRRGRADEHQMVPDADFTSYYGRPIVKASPWAADIPAYLFLGGLAAGSSLLGAGADLSGRTALRRVARLSAAAAMSGSFVALVHDLGKPSRFLNMLRVLKVTSPMSVGTWVVTGYAPFVFLAAASELPAIVPRPLRGIVAGAHRPAGLGAALVAPAVASYTAVLLADTATPTWHGARTQLPFLFVASAAAAAGGMGMLAAPADEAGPARRLALGGVAAELAVQRWMDSTMGVEAEPLHAATPGRLLGAAHALNAIGALGALVGRRSPVASAVGGAALLAGSACTRFGVFGAGQASARDPRYTVVPQRQRMADQGRPGA